MSGLHATQMVAERFNDADCKVRPRIGNVGISNGKTLQINGRAQRLDASVSQGITCQSNAAQARDIDYRFHSLVNQGIVLRRELLKLWKALEFNHRSNSGAVAGAAHRRETTRWLQTCVALSPSPPYSGSKHLRQTGGKSELVRAGRGESVAGSEIDPTNQEFPGEQLHSFGCE